MKLLGLLLTTALSFNINAAPLEAIDCKREMMAAALSKQAQTSTLEALISSTFEVTDFRQSELITRYPYIATIVTTSRVDGTTVTVDYGVRIVDVKSCKIDVMTLAD